MKISSENDVRNLYEETADSYSKMMESEIKLPVYADTLSRLAHRVEGLTGHIVDTSCGSGHMLEMYYDQYDSDHSLIGIDLSPKMVEMAGSRLGKKARVHVGNMSDLTDVTSGASSAVISYFSIHHLDPENVAGALEEWYRILSGNGQLLIAAWEGEGCIDYGEHADLVALRFTREQMVAWVTEAGFHVDRCVVEPVDEIPMDAIYLEASKP